MFPFVFVTETQSAMLLMLLVVAIGIMVPAVCDRDRQWHRTILLSGSILLAIRYLIWRATQTLAPFGLTLDCAASWSLFFIEALSMCGALSAYVILTRVRHRSAEADEFAGWWRPGPAPRVAVLIPTYNEELAVLERTIVGAKSSTYPNAEVLVLDDGKRDWLRDYCSDNGVRYMRRPDNKGSKAGNINHALDRLAEDPVVPEFVAVLDADFVPHRNFLDRTVALFHDSSVGLVQTPQHFFNADPVQHNLGLSRVYPDEQRFFFDDMQPSRDAWGIAACCGTSSITRWTALQEVGGLSTESITEDFMLTIVMENAGWHTIYLDEPLTEGLAPEGLKEYITQRARWCLGMMQIVRSPMGPLARNTLRWRDRWSLVDSLLYWASTFPFRIAVLVYPLLYWFGNVTVVDARVPEVIGYFGVYYFWSMMVLNFIARGKFVPLVTDVSQLLGAIPIARAAITGLVKPHGHKFSVTAKGGDRSRIVVQWNLMIPFAAMLVLTLAALFVGVFIDDFAFYDAGTGKRVVLFWTVYNVFVLLVTLIACVELPRNESHVADKPERATLHLEGGEPHLVWLAKLTQDVARIRGGSYPVGTSGVLQVSGLGEVLVTVLTDTPDGARLLIDVDDAQHEALIQRFYTEGAAPGVTSSRLADIVTAAAQRLSKISRS